MHLETGHSFHRHFLSGWEDGSTSISGLLTHTQKVTAPYWGLNLVSHPIFFSFLCVYVGEDIMGHIRSSADILGELSFLLPCGSQESNGQTLGGKHLRPQPSCQPFVFHFKRGFKLLKKHWNCCCPVSVSRIVGIMGLWHQVPEYNADFEIYSSLLLSHFYSVYSGGFIRKKPGSWQWGMKKTGSQAYRCRTAVCLGCFMFCRCHCYCD